MKKIFGWTIFSILVFSFVFCSCARADVAFPTALRTCQNYSKEGTIPYSGQVFNLLITLNKGKKNQCIYKEKIYQGNDYQMMTCTFEQAMLSGIANSMEKYNQAIKKVIAKNDIFEAKMTNNGEIFNEYLANPKYCKITYKKY